MNIQHAKQIALLVAVTAATVYQFLENLEQPKKAIHQR